MLLSTFFTSLPGLLMCLTGSPMILTSFLLTESSTTGLTFLLQNSRDCFVLRSKTLESMTTVLTLDSNTDTVHAFFFFWKSVHALCKFCKSAVLCLVEVFKSFEGQTTRSAPKLAPAQVDLSVFILCTQHTKYYPGQKNGHYDYA